MLAWSAVQTGLQALLHTAQGTHSLPVSHSGSIPAVTLSLHRLCEVQVIAEVERVGAIEHLVQGLNISKTAKGAEKRWKERDELKMQQMQVTALKWKCFSLVHICTHTHS